MNMKVSGSHSCNLMVAIQCICITKSPDGSESRILVSTIFSTSFLFTLTKTHTQQHFPAHAQLIHLEHSRAILFIQVSSILFSKHSSNQLSYQTSFSYPSTSVSPVDLTNRILSSLITVLFTIFLHSLSFPGSLL